MWQNVSGRNNYGAKDSKAKVLWGGIVDGGIDKNIISNVINERSGKLKNSIIYFDYAFFPWLPREEVIRGGWLSNTE